MGQIVSKAIIVPFVAGASSVVGASVGTDLNSTFRISKKISAVLIPAIQLLTKAGLFMAKNPAAAASAGVVGVSLPLGVTLVASIISPTATAKVIRTIAKKFGANV